MSHPGNSIDDMGPSSVLAAPYDPGVICLTELAVSMTVCVRCMQPCARGERIVVAPWMQTADDALEDGVMCIGCFLVLGQPVEKAFTTAICYHLGSWAVHDPISRPSCST